MRKALPRGSNTRPSIDASRAAHDRIPVCVFLMAALVLAPIGATAAAEVKLRCDIVAYGLITLGETPASHQRRLASFLIVRETHDDNSRECHQGDFKDPLDPTYGIRRSSGDLGPLPVA